MKNYEAEKLKKIIVSKDKAMISQITETDELRKENLILKAQLTQTYNEAYNKALNDVCSKICPLDKYSEIDRVFAHQTKESILKLKKSVSKMD